MKINYCLFLSIILIIGGTLIYNIVGNSKTKENNVNCITKEFIYDGERIIGDIEYNTCLMEKEREKNESKEEWRERNKDRIFNLKVVE